MTFRPFVPKRKFPIARTQYTKLYLDAANGKLTFDPITTESR